MNKQFQVILRAFNEVGQKFDLEIVDGIDLKLDISAIESQEIGELFGISSQQFTLPGNDNNNKFFNNLFNLGTTPAVAFSKSVACQVLVDGEAVFAGKLYIVDIVSDEYNDVVYNCVVVNETVDFKAKVEQKTLGSLTANWSKYNHAYTWTNVSKSWNDNLFTGSILYPLVNYGSNVNDPSSPAIQFSPPTLVGTTGSMDNAKTPLKVSQLKPSIKVKTILDEVFDSLNYKYTSSFITSEYFDSLYYLATPDEREGVTFISPVSSSVLATPATTQSFVSSAPTAGWPGVTLTKINFATELTDTAAAFNPTTSTYTALVTGSFTFGSQLTFTITGTGSAPFSNPREFRFESYVNNVLRTRSSINIGSSLSGTLTMPATVLSLNAGDTVIIKGGYLGKNSNETLRSQAGVSKSFIKVAGAASAYGGTVNIGAVFPPDLTIQDFIKGLAEKFNLVIEPVRNQHNLLRIEPFNTWIDQGTVVDWTDIVDRDTKYKVTSPLQEQARVLKFSDGIDSDVLNQTYQKVYDKVYGEYRYATNLDLAQGEKTIGGKLAATPTKFIVNSQKVELPWLCKEETSKALTPYNFKDRILHRYPDKALQTKTVPANEAKGNNGTSQGFYYVLDGGTTLPINYYATLLPVYYDVFDQPLSTLHYSGYNWKQFKFSQPGTPGFNYTPGTFDNYWAFYINEIYDIDARLLTCNIVLPPNEIQNIQLNDKIFIDGHYYRINKIKAASLTNTDSVEVELLKSAPRKLPFNGRRRIITPRANDPEAFVDVIIDSYQDNGLVVYADFETGQVVSDATIIQQVSGIDGFDYYENVFWDSEEYQIYNPNVLTLGPTTYNESHNSVIAVGNGITLPDGTSNTIVVGTNVALPAESSDLAVFQPIRPIADGYSPLNGQVLVGSIKTQGTKAVEYFKGTYSASQAIELSGSDGQYSYYDLTFTGSNGYTSINLPDTTFVDGLRYQFQVNNTTTTTYYSLIPSGSQTIDGNANKALTVTGSMYEIQVVSGSWKTITQPALGIAGVSTATSASYISVFDTTDQTLDGALTASVFEFNNTDFSRGISLVSSSRFTLSTGGAYNLAFSAQIDKTTGTKHESWFWLRKNGTDVANSNTQVTMGGGSSDKQVAAWNFFVSGSAGDYYEIAWTADSTNVYLNAANAVPGVYPAVPSLIATMNSMY